jgi:hypothetical protein
MGFPPLNTEVAQRAISQRLRSRIFMTPPTRDSNSGGAPSGPKSPGLIWESLIPHVLHPAKVAVIEALLWIGQPLSSKELTTLFGDEEEFYLGLVAYHVRQLAAFGLLEPVKSRQARGALEKYYYFQGHRKEIRRA